MRHLLAVLLLGLVSIVNAATKEVRVFVALCDNKTQGIAPVGAKIGNGDDPDANLYWGCTDGFGSFFRQSKRWKTTKSEKDVSPSILRRMELEHVNGEIHLIAEAYRGSKMVDCLRNFEAASASGKFHLVAFIGHNGLMDFQLPETPRVEGNRTEVIVLCCMSQRYFGDRLSALGCNPLLMTQQLMYPGSFLLHTALETWSKGGSPAEIRAAAATAYGRNQRISTKAASGVFAPIPPRAQ